MQRLTKTQQEVLTLLTQEFLTLKRIAIRRKSSVRSVQKIVKKLKDKGILNNKRFVFQPTPHPLKRFLSLTTPAVPVEHQIRLHSQEFNIRILYKDQRYKEQLKKANTINTDGNTIRLYRNSIEIYSGHSFYADDVQKATADSFDYWNRLFAKVENDLKIIIVKSRSQNIKLVNQHYSEINNEFAKECEKKADKIRVITTDDSKVWFLIDNSFNLHEAETIHPGTAKQDMGDVVRPFFNDLRNNKPPLLSEMYKLVASLLTLWSNKTNVYTDSIVAHTEQINLHLEVMREIGKGVNKFGDSVDTLNSELKALKRPHPDPDKVITHLFNNPLELARFKALNKKEQDKILFGGINE